MLMTKARPFFLFGLVAALAIGSVAAVAAVTAADAPARAPDPRYVWDLNELYPSPEAWTAEYDKAKAEVAKLERFKGTLGRSARAMFEALDTISALNKRISRLYT